MKRPKSAGEDGLIAEVFKYTSDIISPFIKDLFNTIFKNSIYPESWGRGNMVPIHKKGDINCVNNYRGVTLISALAEMYSQLLHDRIA